METYLLFDVCFSSFLQRLESGSIVLHSLLHDSFSNISLNKGRVKLDSCIGILQSFGESEQLGAGESVCYYHRVS